MFVEGKIAIITGGATGIGLCYAKELLKNGLRGVTLADIDVAKGEEAVVQFNKDFGPNKAIFVEADVTKKEQFENIFKKTIETFKNADILINNAGVMNETIWEKEIAINLNGTIYGCILGMEEYFPKYKSGDEAVIVNVSSIAGLSPCPSVPFYTATKHAVIGLSKSLGVPEQYDTSKVRILTICPGITDTPLMTDLNNKMINERYIEILRIGCETRLGPSQGPEVVAESLVKIIEEGLNGSMWMIEGSELCEIEIPERNELKKSPLISL